MIMNYNKMKELLNSFGINFQKHNFDVNFYDVTDPKNVVTLNTYQCEHYNDNKPFNGNKNIIENTVENVFSGNNINLSNTNGLVTYGMHYKNYTINIEDKSNINNEEMLLNEFKCFEMFEDGQYIRTIMSLNDNGLTITETTGELDKFTTDKGIDKLNNFKTTTNCKLIIKNQNGKGYFMVRDEANTRYKNNEYIFYYDENMQITDKRTGLEDVDNIINNSKYFKAVLDILYPELYQMYLEERDLIIK